MKPLLWFIGVCSAAVLAVVIMLAIFVDPRALVLPFWLFSSHGSNECRNDPVRSYVSGQYYPCTGSPLTKENVNSPVKTWKGECPLTIAVRYGNLATFDELVALGASPKLCQGFPDRFYEILLVPDCGDSRAVTAKWLSRFQATGISPKNPNKVLLLAAQGQCPDAAALALDLGASANTQDQHGYSALYQATHATEMAIETASILVAAGADPDLRSSNGESPNEKALRLYGNATNWSKLQRALTILKE